MGQLVPRYPTVFNVVPTAFEIGLVSYILGTRLGPEFAVLTVVGLYAFNPVDP
jgi:ABC-type transport system involved in Fe-S cluster assembly fused permease/ATPase subunit